MKVKGNDWAAGFLQGTTYAYDDWMELFEDEDYRHALVAIFALANEHNPDPEVRPFCEAVNSEQREDLLVSMSASVTVIHRYFEPYRDFNFGEIVSTGTIRRDHPKIGRNEPCPCGSGKKYKKCCAQLSVH